MNVTNYAYGGNYYPMVEDSGHWERDLLLMKEAGINFIRTAEIVNSWDRLQPSEDSFDFDTLDRFFELCVKLDIKVLLGSGSATPPYWVHKKDPSMNLTDQNKRQFPNNATYGWACYNNPTFQEAHQAYLTALVNRYKASPALLAYQINNEIGYPFMPLDSNKMETYCYCKYCQNKYRDWLKEKYKTLDELTYAWSWSTTTTVHQSWEDVLPPFVKPSSWASVTRWLDWRLFHMDVITQQVKRENDLIKKLDKDHPTTTNIFYLKSQDLFGVMSGLDQFEVAKQVDIIGYDLYPGSGNKLEKRPEFSSMFLDHMRSVAKPLNKEYWLAEAEAGPIGGWVLGPDYATNDIDILRNQIETIGHGAKAILYQLFKELPFQPLHWGGIINLDSSKSQRYNACKVIGELLKDNDSFLKNANNPNSKVAIFVSKENQIVLNGINQEQFLYDELRGVYQYFWNRNIQIDFITNEHLESGYAKQYSLVYFPFHPVVSMHLQQSILDLFENNVSIVLSARFGYMDGKGWYSTYSIGELLKNELNISISNCIKKDDIKIEFNGKTLKGYHHEEEISVDHDWNVLAKFDSGTPAVLSKKKDTVEFVYFATHPGHSYILDKANSVISVLDEVLKRIDVGPYVKFEGDPTLRDLLDIHILEKDKKGWLLITHFLNEENKKTLQAVNKQFSCVLPYEIKSMVDVLAQDSVKYVNENNQANVNLEFTENSFYILEFER